MKFLVRLIFIVFLDFPSAASARFAFCLFDDDVVAVVVVVAVVIYLHNFNKLFSLFGLTCAWFGLTECACVDDTAEHPKSTWQDNLMDRRCLIAHFIMWIKRYKSFPNLKRDARRCVCVCVWTRELNARQSRAQKLIFVFRLNHFCFFLFFFSSVSLRLQQKVILITCWFPFFSERAHGTQTHGDYQMSIRFRLFGYNHFAFNSIYSWPDAGAGDERMLNLIWENCCDTSSLPSRTANGLAWLIGLFRSFIVAVMVQPEHYIILWVPSITI